MSVNILIIQRSVQKLEAKLLSESKYPEGVGLKSHFWNKNKKIFERRVGIREGFLLFWKQLKPSPAWCQEDRIVKFYCQSELI